MESSDDFVPAPPADPLMTLAYAWSFVRPTDDPSGELIAGIAERPDRDRFSFFKAEIWGMEGYTDWPTSSWLEVAISPDGDFRVLWKSGIADTIELPSTFLSDWDNAPDAETALEKLTKRLDESGRPMIGVCGSERIQEANGRWRERPIVWGFDFGKSDK